ncbi:hypothetical protein [Rhizobium sp. TRM95796]|uniref:hypothetical protein n=1 Tax=Rhizobium sp. TRM95796 TaxID=2979862 RepID=UPI0021E96C9F|nr:hypothetical protein [Rhizobium sp. TRM95796]MCV3765145.1 hypothetical protein [Rhizobium sp. TRM95796]
MTNIASLPTLADFSAKITSASVSQITNDLTLGGSLRLATEGPITTSYAPFETINEKAKVVICGITPGRRQATDALLEARRQLLRGADVASAARAAKATASFAGSMRANITAMLDYLGLHEKLGIQSSAGLFGSSAHLVHYTSAIRYPTFVGAKDYGGSSPPMTSSPLLKSFITSSLVEEAIALPNALWIPLGGKVEEAIQLLVGKGLIRPERVLTGMPHASGANAERIAYFLERKQRALLSQKTNAAIIDTGREKARRIVSNLAL